MVKATHDAKTHAGMLGESVDKQRLAERFVYHDYTDEAYASEMCCLYDKGPSCGVLYTPVPAGVAVKVCARSYGRVDGDVQMGNGRAAALRLAGVLQRRHDCGAPHDS